MTKAMVAAVTAGAIVTADEAGKMFAEAKASGKFIGTLKKLLIEAQIAKGKDETAAKRDATKVCNDVAAAYHSGTDNLSEAQAAVKKFIEAGNTFEGTSKTGRPQFKKLSKAAFETSAAIAIAKAQLGQQAASLRLEGKAIDIDDDGNVIGK